MKTHSYIDGVPVIVHEYATTQLFCVDCGETEHEDDRGHMALSGPIGYFRDAEDRWRLWYAGQKSRRDREPSEFPLYWERIEYTNPRSRKYSTNLEDVFPFDLAPSAPLVSGSEARLVAQLGESEEGHPRNVRRVLHKVAAFDLGMRTIERMFPPWFRIEDGKDDVTVVLQPSSTARVLHRIYEQVGMHLPSPVKDSRVEPLLKFMSFIHAMDYHNFGQATSMCVRGHVAAFSTVTPEPHRTLILEDIEREVKKQLQQENELVPITIPKDITSLIKTGPDDGAITIDQIAIDLGHDRQCRGAATPRRIAERLEKLKIPIGQSPYGEFIALSDYRQHRKTLLRHGNEKTPK